MSQNSTYLKYLLLLCCFFVLTNLSLSAQQYPWINYTVDDGLPTNYVYGAVELDGIIWVFTEAGLSRFDGHEFKNFTAADGLPANDIWLLERDKKGRGNISSFKRRSSFIENDSINSLSGIVGKSVSTIFNGSTYLNKINEKRYVYQDDTTKSFNYFNNIGSNYNYSSPIYNIQILSTSIVLKKQEESKEDFELPIKKIKLRKIDGESRSVVFGPSEDHIILLNERGFIIINVNEKVLVETLWSEVGFSNISSAGTLWLFPNVILNTNEGFVKINTEGKIAEVFNVGDLNNKTDVLRVLPDSRGNVWVGTQGSGLFFLPKHNRNHENIITLPAKSNGIELLLPTSKGNILAFPDDGSPLVINKNNSVNPVPSVELNSFTDAIELQDGSFLISSQKGLKHWSEKSGYRKLFNNYKNFINETKYSLKGRDLDDLPPLKIMAYDVSSKVLLATANEILFLIIFHGDTLILKDSKISVKNLVKASDKGVWIVAENGIWKYSFNRLYSVVVDPDLGFASTMYEGNEKLFIVTEDKGLFSYDLLTRSLIHVADMENINKLKKGVDQTVLICTNQGLLRIDEKTGKIIFVYRKASGLSSNQVHDVYEDKEGLIVATNKGLDYITRVSEIVSTELPPLKINSFQVNGKEQNINVNRLRFSSTEDNIQIKYILQDYESARDIQYFTKLSPLQSEWHQSSTAVDYLALGSGHYSFELKAKRFNGQEVLYKNKIEFRIRPILLKNPWFYLIASILAIGIIIYIIRFRQKKSITALEKQNDVNKKISEMQLSALRSQMNPHFIFNALGAIQYFVQTQNTEMADDYLSQFAFLMRKYLEASKRPSINLKEELELLQLYTNIEEMRFDHQFTTVYLVHDSIDSLDTMIPSVLIQPFIENSILHGLQPRKTASGLLKVTFDPIGDDLLVKIVDNGIGVSNGKFKKDPIHKSRGLENIKDRIRTISHSTGMEIDFSTSTPHPENEKFPGHEVKIIFKNLL